MLLDAIGAIPVHLGAGIWGTLAVALFGRTEIGGTNLDRLSQLGVQILGISVCGLLSFGGVYLTLSFLKRFVALRVSPQEERDGLNVSEHGASTEMLDLYHVMELQAKSGDLNLRVPVEPFTEVGQIASRYNCVMDSLEQSNGELTNMKQALDQTMIVAFTDTAGRITYANDRFCEISQYPREELIGQDHRILNSGYHSREFMHTLWKTIREGRVWHGQIRNKAKDGSFYWVQTVIVPILDRNDKPWQFIAIRYDITEIIQAQQLKEEHLNLKDAMKSMEKVMGVVCHELRTPLAALRATTEYLLAFGATEMDKCDTFLKSINGEVVRMAEMVNNMLEAARLNSGKVKWNWGTICLQTACDSAFEIVRPLVDPTKIDLGVEIHPPESSMQGDTEALQRLLINLISNSAKHTTDGSIRVIVREQHENGERWVELKVIDTGDGIPDNVLDKLGKAFVLNAGCVGSDYVKGTGLGLAICTGIVAAHGGTVQVESEIGTGSTFTVRMPADLSGPIESGEAVEIDVNKEKTPQSDA